MVLQMEEARKVRTQPQATTGCMLMSRSPHADITFVRPRIFRTVWNQMGFGVGQQAPPFPPLSHCRSRGLPFWCDQFKAIFSCTVGCSFRL
ncbi:hypothetical protein QR685DRAFT_334720 [Neurospora intermedia]|uniref:Uncharacterized protein n=1 Tax=Neurospora intermedia TaxID=5142 RepID=A0ABR3D900_NEUIN